MQDFQQQFIELALRHNVLNFGSFTLKSGRQSPYFFNAGKFYSGSALSDLGAYYAQALLNTKIEFNMLFGPAYKGIPLVSTTAVALAREHNIDIPYSFNRKEAKTHGEGGQIVGAPLDGKVAVLDDVITAGTAMREVFELLAPSKASACVIVLGLDRQEKGLGNKSAIQELEDDTGVKVTSIINLDDILAFLETRGEMEVHGQVAEYRDKYGV